jgi:hypothetical protein
MSKNKAKRPGKGGVGGGPGGKAGSAKVKCPPPTEYHLHVDANRDGAVDDDRTGIDNWKWGKGKKGAIILCNNDDDDAATQCDNEDGVINGGNDHAEIAPIDIRRIGPFKPGWKGRLSVSADAARRIRLFDSRGPGGNEIIGPTAGKSYQFPDLNFTKKKLGMEALYYAGKDFPTGVVRLTFTIEKTDGTVLEEYAQLRVAPWIMPNHLDGADTVYVVDSTQNGQFRTDLDKFVKAAGCTLVTHAVFDDVWMQDCMELGYTNLPTVGFRSTMLAPRPRPLETFPITLRTKDFGYHAQGGLRPESTFDSTGNLEVTPPLTSQAGNVILGDASIMVRGERASRWILTW